MRLNAEVTEFLNLLEHPLREEIELIRSLILDTDSQLSENIKWNGPNYSYEGQDRITMKMYPPKQIQLIFHRGAKVLSLPAERLIEDPSKLMSWKSNDRAVISFKDLAEIKSNSSELIQLIKDWIRASSL
ncbi:DUF1801 domain-containing protein [Algoriphagus sp. D3-2-R+10]|uniref:DUF1801 domain-containing protein n=1 Tax=Algoriphagus aurantiacus TaxID=3103948 RepID=UPI002B3F1575|nr:DUF1801 domain-containing protein [Algoriphagus sp. D3-2-R+10]MEB2775873.1 DUF1801 domain-containing protein [Algoriphagus sp. D3-2-R+10]